MTQEKPLLVTNTKAKQLLGVGNTKYWELVKKGLVEQADLGGTKMVVYASLERLAGASNAQKAA